MSAGGGLSLALDLRSFSVWGCSFLADAFGGELGGVAKTDRLPTVDTDGEVVVVDALFAQVEALVVVCWFTAVTGGVVRLRRARGMYTARSGRRSRCGRAGLLVVVLLLGV